MKISRDYFLNKKVLITGHTGFKGSWLSIWLKKLGAQVIGYALSPYSDKDNFVVSNLSNKIIDIRGDVRDFNKLNNIFREYKPEIVFHLAAQPLVRLSYEIPKDTYDINIGGTVNVLEAIRRSDSVKIGVIITTDKCYENKEWVWGYREIDTLGGYDPYSSSKAAAEIVVSGFIKSFFNPGKYHEYGKSIATARAGNVIGGGDWSLDRIIPDCIRALEQKNPILIRNPEARRPWQHVLEPLKGYIMLAQKMMDDGGQYSGAWNFGPDYNNSIKTVKDIVIDLVKYWGGDIERDIVFDTNKSKLHEANMLALDCSKSRFNLGWEPTLSVCDALKMTIDWYKNYKTYKTSDVYELCIKQINDYNGI